jgi:hypothetical protein
MVVTERGEEEREERGKTTRWEFANLVPWRTLSTCVHTQPNVEEEGKGQDAIWLVSRTVLQERGDGKGVWSWW